MAGALLQEKTGAVAWLAKQESQLEQQHMAEDAIPAMPSKPASAQDQPSQGRKPVLTEPEQRLQHVQQVSKKKRAKRKREGSAGKLLWPVE